MMMDDLSGRHDKGVGFRRPFFDYSKAFAWWRVFFISM